MVTKMAAMEMGRWNFRKHFWTLPYTFRSLSPPFWTLDLLGAQSRWNAGNLGKKTDK